MKALVTGGYFDDSGECVVWLVDLATERADVLLRWTPAPQHRVSGKGFAGGTLAHDGLLYVAAHGVVVRVDPRTATVTGVLHQPCMNDLHHVASLDGRLYVSNTGLGAVDVFALEGTFLGSHSLLPTWVNARRMTGDDPPDGCPPVDPGWTGSSPAPWPSRRGDDGYHSTNRRSAPFHQLKVPDHLHVNHVSRVGGRLLATCFADGTLRDLETFSVASRASRRFIHDGFCHADTLWLSAIDGTLMELDARTLQERRTIATFDSGHCGWCRGLAVTDDHLLVGLTQVQAARRPLHPWAERSPDVSETSVVLLDRHEGRLVARVDLTDDIRHAKVYSILLTEMS